jgi:hypothetical protein
MSNGQGLRLIEPLRSLYKDEVRGTYQILNFPFVVSGDEIVSRRSVLAHFLANFMSHLIKNECANIVGQSLAELSDYQSNL